MIWCSKQRTLNCGVFRTLFAEELKAGIYEETELLCSVEVAPNRLLTKCVEAVLLLFRNMGSEVFEPLSTICSDGVNFASAGAGLIENKDSTLKVMPLRTQLNDFKKVVALMVEKVGEANAKKVLMRSVFLISLGGNDYFSFNTNDPNATEIDRRNHMHMVLAT